MRISKINPKAEKRKRGRPAGSSVRQLITKNAATAFAKNGYQGCTVEHILEETGASRTNFYRFFTSKEDVFECILQDKLSRLDALLSHSETAIETEASAEERLSFMLDTYLRACFSVGELLPVLLQEQLSLPGHRAVREQMIRQFKRTITEIVVKNGFVRPDDLILEGCLAAIDRITLLQSLKVGEPEAKIRKIKNTCLQFTFILLRH